MKNVIEEQSLNADATSGAMENSERILKAVVNSIENSRKGNLGR